MYSVKSQCFNLSLKRPGHHRKVRHCGLKSKQRGAGGQWMIADCRLTLKLNVDTMK